MNVREGDIASEEGADEEEEELIPDRPEGAQQSMYGRTTTRGWLEVVDIDLQGQTVEELIAETHAMTQKDRPLPQQLKIKTKTKPSRGKLMRTTGSRHPQRTSQENPSGSGKLA